MKLRKNNGGKEAWQLSAETILQCFRGSDEWGEYLAGIQLEKALRRFIASPKGLDSSFDEGEFEALMAMARKNENADYTDFHGEGGEVT